MPSTKEMKNRPLQCSVIDAFTRTPFKGNPAAVCLLKEERDDEWLQAVAAEFHTPATAFLIPMDSKESIIVTAIPRFHLRWFSRNVEVKLCGHATIAATHFLITSGLVRTDQIEFLTKSGLVTAKMVEDFKQRHPKSGLSNGLSNGAAKEHFSIELNFPAISTVDCDSKEIPLIPKTLDGASLLNIQKTALGDLILELSSGEVVAGLQPNIEEIRRCSARGILVTGSAPLGSGFDFFTRFFCPKLGVDEDPVCGSAHCALAPYWSKKLGKRDLIAYMASPRGGRLELYVEEDNQRVLIRGEAVTVMTGTLLL